jgi:PAS domain S-box-containing protein
MGNPNKAKWSTQPAVGYGLALVSVAAAAGLTELFLYFHLPLAFNAFALSAIAITFWYGGTGPGILTAVFSALVRSYVFDPGINSVSRVLYDLVFLVFALLMTAATRARDELEVRVAERTRELTRASADLKLEIVERKRAEAELRVSEAYLAEAQRLSHTGSFGWRPSTGEIIWSEETFRIFQYDRTTAPTVDLILQRVHPEDAALVKEIIERASRDGQNFEFEHRLLMPDGSVKHVHVLARASSNGSGRVDFVGAVMDVTLAKQAEQTLRESEAYLAEAQRLSHTGSWASIPALGEIRYLSEECYRVLGFDPRAGQPRYETFFNRIHPDDQAKVREAVETAGREKTEFELDYRIIHPGGDVRDIHVIGHPVFSSSGNLVEFVGTVIDVTERKQADEERERLRQAQADLARIGRVTTMGELTASLAHEVNQPIAAAVTDANTCLRWLKRDPPDLEEAREAASRTIRDATRAAEIISRVRQLFKKGIPQRELVDLNRVIQEMVVLLRSEAARYSISVRTELSADLPCVMGDRVQLQQVLMNLVMNSIDAMKDVHGTRELTIQSQPGENEQLVLSVSDTGVGLPPQKAEQIFDAFFTTKPHGTGMGLRISRSIVESHGGRLWADDNSSRGASFHLTLPTKIEAHE